jgi:hypothetical protein
VPIIYRSRRASCSQCGAYFEAGKFTVESHPHYASKSRADQEAASIGIQNGSLKMGTREAKPHKGLKPLPGQKELIQ